MHDHDHAHDLDWATMVDFAEREAELLIGFLAEATSSLAEVAARGGLAVRRILDIGSGPGVGTCALAEAFGSASVVAADGSAEMLANVAARAERLGVSERVETHGVDLPDGLNALGHADLVWASMVLHHVGDEAAALRGIRSRMEPGGVLGLAEFGDPLRFLPVGADPGGPGVWERLNAARETWLADMRAGLPGAAPSADLPTMLEGAGFELLIDRMMTVRLDPPLPGPGRQVAHRHLTLMREHVAPYAEPGDLAVLDDLTEENGPAGVLLRPDALLHASRRLLVARAVA